LTLTSLNAKKDPFFQSAFSPPRVVKFAAYLLTLDLPIGHFSNNHVLLIRGVLIVAPVTVFEILASFLDQLFVEYGTGAIPGEDSIAG
jgi:hypothetical protein